MGLDKNGRLGKIYRKGQDEVSTSCGAAIDALAACKRNPLNLEFKNGCRDHQMDCIKNMLQSRVDEIDGDDND